jgi:hypothetical protein
MKKYKILAFVIVLIYFSQSFFLSYGGIGADSLSYFGIAADFPNPETNLFPLGFPFLIHLFHQIFQDYFWATKFLTLSMVVFVLLFSWFKKFYFKETVLLFCGKTLFFAFVNIGSEGPFLFLLYFLIYFIHQIFNENKKLYFSVIAASLIIVLLFTVRYSAIYIWLGIVVFTIILILKSKEKFLLKPMISLILISGFGIFAYLLMNYFVFGSFTGENLRGKPAAFYPVYIFRDVMGVVNVANPFIGIKPASNGFGSLAFQFILMIIDFALIRYFYKLVKKKRAEINFNFHQLLWILAGVYSFSLLISGYFQQIEEMNVRMLAAANFCLFFSFLIIYFKNLKSDKIIFLLSCFFLFFLTLYNLKIPVFYLKSRAEIAKQMPKFEDKKYLFNDERDQVKTTSYIIPIINKSFNYKHTNSQIGEIKQSISGSLNPKIKWLKYDTIPNKNEVLYTSELKLND